MALSHPTERLNDDLLNVIRAVLAEPAHEWTVAEMAAVGHRSISAFHRAFAAQLGSGPKSWLEQVRAEHAATLLARTAMPVAQVARDSGWSDPNYFSRRFRARYGTQPSQYRRAFSAIQGDRHGGSRSAS
jgi:AraC-like DNA-binding protein